MPTYSNFSAGGPRFFFFPAEVVDSSSEFGSQSDQCLLAEMGVSFLLFVLSLALKGIDFTTGHVVVIFPRANERQSKPW